MYRSHTNKQQDKNWENRETVESFLARGGQISKHAEGESGKKKRKNKNTVDAQKLLDNCKTEAEQAAVITYLKSQGIEVE